MKTPKIPRGYRLLKVGEARPEGYKWLDVNQWADGLNVGDIYWHNECVCIAPRPKRKAKK